MFFDWERPAGAFRRENFRTEYCSFADGLIIQATNEGIFYEIELDLFDEDGNLKPCSIPNFHSEAYWVCSSCRLKVSEPICDRAQDAPTFY